SLLLRCAQILHIFHLSDTMIRVVLLVLLTLTASMAIKCYYSMSVNGNDYGTARIVDCDEIVKYCYTLDLPDHSTMKDCGMSIICKQEGYNDVPFMGATAKCCTGDYCNSAARSSLLLTVLAAAAAAFHWI
ncbi:hypothetical protein PENTCL1PPCAC_21554, partial [Pristionchus entomophagus]